MSYFGLLEPKKSAMVKAQRKFRMREVMMPRVDSAEFQKWLDTRSQIDEGAERILDGCEQCGIAEAVCPFMRGYCFLCLGYLYGQFVKCQQLVMWMDMNLPIMPRGDINDRADKILRLGREYRLPWPDETDEGFAARCLEYAER